jgi:uncharacterized UPF0160 family protein
MVYGNCPFLCLKRVFTYEKWFMVDNIIKKSVGLHDGVFHADDVTASCLLMLFEKIEKDKIFRTRDDKVLTSCEYVCDVGGVYDKAKKRLDHHQKEYNGGLSSAGMVLLLLLEQGDIDKDLYDFINESLVIGVDAEDNGIVMTKDGTCSFSDVISNFLPIVYGATKEEMDKAFFEALDFTYNHLQRSINRYNYINKSRALVKQAMDNNDYVLMFDEAIPWIENFFYLDGEHHSAKFVIMPTGKHWKLRCIPPSMKDKMNVRHPLPLAWAGLLGDDLKSVTKIAGAVFCHKGRFVSIWEKRDDAIAALKLVDKED